MVPSESDAPKSASENSESEPEITVAEIVEFSGSNEVLAGNESISAEIVAELVEFSGADEQNADCFKSPNSSAADRSDRRFLLPPPIQVKYVRGVGSE